MAPTVMTRPRVTRPRVAKTQKKSLCLKGEKRPPRAGTWRPAAAAVAAVARARRATGISALPSGPASKANVHASDTRNATPLRIAAGRAADRPAGGRPDGAAPQGPPGGEPTGNDED